MSFFFLVLGGVTGRVRWSPEVSDLVLDELHGGVELADADDAAEVADFAVVEDQVARGCVVAEVANVGVGPWWRSLQR